MKIVARILIVSMVVNGFFSHAMDGSESPVNDAGCEKFQCESDGIEQCAAISRSVSVYEEENQRMVEEYLPCITPAKRREIIRIQDKLAEISCYYATLFLDGKSVLRPSDINSFINDKNVEDNKQWFRTSEIIEGCTGRFISPITEFYLLKSIADKIYKDRW